MKLYKKLFLIIIALSLLANVFGQEEIPSEFAPYPGRIKIGIRQNNIILTWEDSKDIKNGYSVYRNKAFPSEINFNESEFLGYIDSGEKGFEYRPDTTQPYYYFVLGRAINSYDNKVLEYRIFIPLRNVILEPVKIDRIIETAEQLNPSKYIKATILDSYIKIDSTTYESGDVLAIYRSLKPILKPSDLLESLLVNIIPSEQLPYNDYPVPNIEYYYAIIPESELVSGKIELRAGINTLKTPVSISASSSQLSENPDRLRKRPLPYLVLSKGFNDTSVYGLDIPQAQLSILPSTKQIVDNIIFQYGLKEKITHPPLTIEYDDKSISGKGELYMLRTVLATSFSVGKYTMAVQQLTTFLSLPRSNDAYVRACFYRGQAQAMLGNYKEALLDFLKAKPGNFKSCHEWMEYCLNMLTKKPS